MEKTCAAPTVTTYGQKFDPVHSLAKLYFGESLNILKDYCKQHLNCNTSSAELWRQKNFDFISPKNQPSPFTFHDYSDGTDVHINVTDEASAIDTLKTISRSVLILDAAFHHITEKDRVDCFNSTYYNKVMQIINQMKEELESVLRKLEIKEPDFVPLYFGTENKEVRDWVVLREYLKLMTYIKKVFPALEEIIFNGKHT